MKETKGGRENLSEWGTRELGYKDTLLQEWREYVQQKGQHCKGPMVRRMWPLLRARAEEAEGGGKR